MEFYLDTKKDDHGERSVLYRHHYPPRGRWWLKGGTLFLYIVLLLMLFLLYAHISKSMCIIACQCGDSDNAHADSFTEGFEDVRHTSATPLCFQIPSSKIGPIASTPKSRKQSPTF